ncbi:MAG TPA: hypothetical protein DDY32_19365 [Desulfobulbaceae bacterium]|nr:hypothetical protein [Desulfobulbaceae bacterium]
MKRKIPPADGDMEFVLQPFNTPGNEVAPGSDIVGEYFQIHVGCHLLEFLEPILQYSLIISPVKARSMEAGRAAEGSGVGALLLSQP